MNKKKLTKSMRDKKICGVCSGLAIYLGIDVTVIRLIWAVVTIASFGFGILAYFIAALILPEDESTI